MGNKDTTPSYKAVYLDTYIYFNLTSRGEDILNQFLEDVMVAFWADEENEDFRKRTLRKYYDINSGMYKMALAQFINIFGKHLYENVNEPIIVDGREDYAKSRRVELKIKVRDWNVASAFGIKR